MKIASAQQWTRRRFIRAGLCASAASLLATSAVARPKPRRISPNEKLNLAIIGVGGRGGTDIEEVSSENIVALCDVNERNLNAAAAKYPSANRFYDYRRVYDKARDFDAVVVATTEHTHAFAVLPALQLGKHVYCEKPLAHTVWEARLLAQHAAKARVATQMGTQMHATDNFRRVVELIQANAIGPVREVEVWVSRAWGDGGRPEVVEPVPAWLHWDLWLGPAPERPFNSSYINGQPRWYKYWDFGGGTLPDLGSHWNDLPFWALNLRHPLTIEAHGPPVSPETAPASYHIVYEYGTRGSMPPVKLTWHQGTDKPARLTDRAIPPWDSGILFVGDAGMLLANYQKHVLLPEEKFNGFQPPPPSIPSSIGHWKEWIQACKTGSATTCNFGYSGALTEANHLGNVAYRTGTKLEWDAAKLKARNCADAARFIRTEYRKGWSLS